MADKADYATPKYDVEKLKALTTLREEANLSQDRAAEMVGLKGKQRRNAVGDWESGKRRPASRRRKGFMRYLLDGLRLRRDEQAFQGLWETVCVGEWRWRPLTDSELVEAFPSRARKKVGRYQINGTLNVVSLPPDGEQVL